MAGVDVVVEMTKTVFRITTAPAKRTMMTLFSGPAEVETLMFACLPTHSVMYKASTSFECAMAAIRCHNNKPHGTHWRVRFTTDSELIEDAIYERCGFLSRENRDVKRVKTLPALDALHAKHFADCLEDVYVYTKKD